MNLYFSVTHQYKKVPKPPHAVAWNNNRQYHQAQDTLIIHKYYGDSIVIDGRIVRGEPLGNGASPMMSFEFPDVTWADVEIISKVGGFGGSKLPNIANVFVVPNPNGEIEKVEIPAVRPLYKWRENYPYPYPSWELGSWQEALAAFERESEAPRRIGGHPKGDSKSCPCPHTFPMFAQVVIE